MFGFSPPLLPCLSFSAFLFVAGRAYCRQRERGRSQIIRRRESLVLYKQFNTLWCKWYKVLPQVASPTSKSSRSDSRTSFGSIFETPAKEKSSERVSPRLRAINIDLSSIERWSATEFFDYLYSSIDEFKDIHVLLSYFRLNSWHWLYSTYVDLLWEIIMREAWMCIYFSAAKSYIANALWAKDFPSQDIR
jgi:hypothetical protein